MRTYKRIYGDIIEYRIVLSGTEMYEIIDEELSKEKYKGSTSIDVAEFLLQYIKKRLNKDNYSIFDVIIDDVNKFVEEFWSSNTIRVNVKSRF